jgi:hypothetical protein
MARPRLAASCTVPRAGAALVCRVCHGPTAGAGYSSCWSCSVVSRRMQSRLRPSPTPSLANSRATSRSPKGAPGASWPPAPVVPITLFQPRSPVHRAVVGYKSSNDAGERAFLARDLADLVGMFLTRHGGCIARLAGGGWDYLDVVPSTRRCDRSIHPLAQALGVAPFLAAREAGLLCRGDAPLDHLEPDPGGFVARPTVGAPSRVRVLLLDDVFTTGARAFSAAHALAASGAEVVAIVPIGRMVHTDDDRARRWWEDAYHPTSALDWSNAPCCLGCSAGA